MNGNDVDIFTRFIQIGGLAGIWFLVGLAFKAGVRLTKIEAKLDIAAGQAAEVPQLKTELAVLKATAGSSRVQTLPGGFLPVPSL